MGADYLKHFSSFEQIPFAAASIGQVHIAYAKETNKKLAVKVQYPGVEKSIKSDIDNLMTLLNVANLLPKGLYVENVIKHIKVELFNECDYIREASCNKKFAELLKDDPAFLVPKVYENLTTKNVLVTEFADGVPVDQCLDLDQETRNYVNNRMTLKKKLLFFQHFFIIDCRKHATFMLD